MRQKLTIFIILSLLALTGCNQSGSDKSKELEL
jgi:Prokaryotic membrane lipoprotein lipid attachment site